MQFVQVLPVLYDNTGAKYALQLCDYAKEQMASIAPNVTMQGVFALLSIVANVICISVIIKRSIEAKKNPYTNDIFVGTRDYEEAMNRAEK